MIEQLLDFFKQAASDEPAGQGFSTVQECIIDSSWDVWSKTLDKLQRQVEAYQVSQKSTMSSLDSLDDKAGVTLEERLEELRPIGEAYANMKARVEAWNIWEAFGCDLGLDEFGPELVKEESDIRTYEPWWKVVGCSFPECLCAGTVAEHPLRACNGCGLAVYCSRICQKKLGSSLCFEISNAHAFT